MQGLVRIIGKSPNELNGPEVGKNIDKWVQGFMQFPSKQKKTHKDGLSGKVSLSTKLAMVNAEIESLRRTLKEEKENGPDSAR